MSIIITYRSRDFLAMCNPGNYEALSEIFGILAVDAEKARHKMINYPILEEELNKIGVYAGVELTKVDKKHGLNLYSVVPLVEKF